MQQVTDIGPSMRPVNKYAICPVTDMQHSMQMVLKCADIGHLAADMATHKRWAYLLEEEFFRQVITCLPSALHLSQLLSLLQLFT